MHNILLISLSCIGDVILTTPVIKSLKDNFPGVRLTVVSGPTAAPLLSRHELVDAVIVCNNKAEHRGLWGIAKLCMTLRKKKFDMVVDLRNTAIPYFMRTRYRVTSYRAHIKNRGNDSKHAIDRHLDVLESAGIPPTTRNMVVTIPQEVATSTQAFLEKKGLVGKTLIAVYAGAGSPYKIYPPRLMVETLKQLSSPETYFLLIGSDSDRDICTEIAGAVGDNIMPLAGELNILETGGLLARCRILISNDSGPMHLGVALGIPTVGIFGPTNAERYGPRGGMHRIVWRRESCNPCKQPECNEESCIGRISPDEISAAARELLS